MQLRRAAGDIKGGNVCDGEKAQNAVNDSPAHHLCACRPGLDVAVNAGQITVAPHVDLKNVDSPPLEIAATRLNLLSKSLHESLPYLISLSPRLSLSLFVFTDSNSNPARKHCRTIESP